MPAEIWLEVDSQMTHSSVSSLSDLCERIFTAFDEQPVAQTPSNRYWFMEATPVGGTKQQLSKENQAATSLLLRQTALSHICVRSYIFARNPYILHPEVIDRYSVSLTIEQVAGQPEMLALQLAFGDSGQWFDYWGVPWEPTYAFVQDYLAQGYVLNMGDPNFPGCYTPDPQLSDINRRKVLKWVGHLIQIVHPTWLVASYEDPVHLEAATGTLSYIPTHPLIEAARAGPLFYALGPGITFPELEHLKDKRAYYTVTVAGMTLFADVEYFGFLRDQSELSMW